MTFEQSSSHPVKKLREDFVWLRFRFGFEKSELDETTIGYYLDTNFAVVGDSPFVMNIGVLSQELRDCYARYGVAAAAYLTAFNPYGVNLELSDNRIRQDRLRAEIAARDLMCLEGVGSDPANVHREDSLLVLGLGLDEACSLGWKYEQNAIVWCGSDAVPVLVLLK